MRLDSQETELQCTASGNPIPTVSIIKTNDVNIISTELRSNIATKVIKHTESSSEFECTARSIFGHVNSSKWLPKESFSRNFSKLQNATDKCLSRAIGSFGNFTVQRFCECINLIFPLIVFTISLVSTITVTCYFLWIKGREIIHLDVEEEQEDEEEENYDEVTLEMQY